MADERLPLRTQSHAHMSSAGRATKHANPVCLCLGSRIITSVTHARNIICSELCNAHALGKVHDASELTLELEFLAVWDGCTANP